VRNRSVGGSRSIMVSPKCQTRYRHLRYLLLRIRDSEEKICLQKNGLAVEHRVKQ
jgi:hypothetical protein